MNLELNPLDVLGKRQLNFMPPHFVKTVLPEVILFDDSILSWVRSKLKGRFALMKIPVANSDNKVVSKEIIGFEDAKEMTYFLLACPHLRRT